VGGGGGGAQTISAHQPLPLRINGWRTLYCTVAARLPFLRAALHLTVAASLPARYRCWHVFAQHAATSRSITRLLIRSASRMASKPSRHRWHRACVASAWKAYVRKQSIIINGNLDKDGKWLKISKSAIAGRHQRMKEKKSENQKNDGGNEQLSQMDGRLQAYRQ
jgi:hypothetical protein